MGDGDRGPQTLKIHSPSDRGRESWDTATNTDSNRILVTDEIGTSGRVTRVRPR